MAVSLQFNAEECYRALVERLINVADSIMEDFYNDAILGLDAKGKEDSERIKAIWDETQEKVIAECKFYANALMDSFGTGSLADTSADSYWQEYTHSRLFNPLRKGTPIVGRKRGSYINIYGKQRSTWGNSAGQNIESIIKPTAPKRSIQNAEKWLLRNHQRKVEDRIEEEVKRFFAEEARKFFVEVSI